MSKRKERIAIRLFKEEKNLIEWLASEDKLNVGTFIRKTLLDLAEKKKFKRGFSESGD